ncbi:MAG TPA: hypothetical protein PLD95_01680 [bacterium]|jgi:hypothetical protein|nr:hypothetical protein [bacterium]HOG38159.1 hypothetical protein [bacterium]HQI03379.1 hypothetical protein [bacterium]
MNNLLSKKLLQKCPVCGDTYNYSKVKLLEANDSYILSYFKCQKCGTGVAMKAIFIPTGMVGQAVITDLEADEIMKLKNNNESITSADVLCVYDFIKNEKDIIKAIQ